MSVQFQEDAQALASPVTAVTTAETNGPQTNFLTIPYQNAKGVGFAIVFFTPAASITTITVRVRRNINAENVIVASQVLAAGFTAGSLGALYIGWTDPIPDNRAVQYTVTVQQAGVAANGTIAAGSMIDATTISG
jgi:hypothetical protein